MSMTIRMKDGDFEFETAGEQVWTSRAEKMAQDWLEELLLPYDVETDRGNELFDPDGNLTSIAGSATVGAAAIKSMLKTATQRFMRRQTENSDTDAEEVLRKIKSIIVQAINNDPTNYGFVLVGEASDTKIALARALRLGHLGPTNRPLVGGYDL